MVLPEFLDADLKGPIRIRGSRLRLIDIAGRYDEGLSAEEICEHYDSLSLPLIYKIVAYYLENQAEVEQLMAADRQLSADLEARSPKGPSIAELRRRLIARHTAEAS